MPGIRPQTVAAMIDGSLREVVQGLARRTPTPGGGAAAALAGAMGAALLELAETTIERVEGMRAEVSEIVEGFRGFAEAAL